MGREARNLQTTSKIQIYTQIATPLCLFAKPEALYLSLLLDIPFKRRRTITGRVTVHVALVRVGHPNHKASFN